MSKTKLFLQGLTLFALALSAGCSSSNPNGYYENDGPPGLFQKKIFPWGGSEVKLKVEQPNKWANRPYTVMGKRYYPVTGDKAMNQVGTASWYGKQFHGKKTAIGEVYDMHAMTAAHPTMELPSFAKVTNLENGRSVIVRVNDRGPFLHGRIIDLSYAAAVKLGYQKKARPACEWNASRAAILLRAGFRPQRPIMPCSLHQAPKRALRLRLKPARLQPLLAKRRRPPIVRARRS